MKNDIAKIGKSLTVAYRGRETAQAGEHWETRVMGHIRSLNLRVPAAGFSALFGSFLWRMVPVACLLIIVLTAGLVTLDYTPEYDITATFMTDPVESAVSQLWEG